jgi:selenocysteine lyase/cysteine desulfurase
MQTRSTFRLPIWQRAMNLLSVTSSATPTPVISQEGPAILDRVRNDLIGNRVTIHTPFGEKPLIYADYTASGRALGFLEENIREKVLPYYANTHTEASFTGAQTNALREAARTAIRQSVNGSADDKVIFCGSGATAAVNRLIDILGLRLPHDLDQRFALIDQIPPDERPVVFVGPYEHHSNELPWRETIADVVRIGLDCNGRIDQRQLSEKLEEFAERPLRIGSFSAASNVTGIRSDVPSITTILKSAGAMAFWDYAAAGPYVDIDMNADNAPIDAVFISPHKFIGGPGTPGLLIAKSHLLRNTVPAVVGGGTVSYVSPTEHRYLADPEHREEGGTPAIVESIRAGAVFSLKDQIGAERIESIEQTLVLKALDHLKTVQEIEVLGPVTQDRLGIFSMRIKYAGRDLHHGFIAALLNDLFGIQARGGCSCAGPYGHDLLNIDAEISRDLDALVTEGFECFKPGWVRVNFHYAAHLEEVDYILGALQLIATLGWRLLPSYELDWKRGTWRHKDDLSELPITLADLLKPHAGQQAVAAGPGASLEHLLDLALATLQEGSPASHRATALEEQPFPEELERRRWFATSFEAASALKG